jgi:hypothetical protein
MNKQRAIFYNTINKLGTEYLRADTLDELRMFCQYCENEFNIEELEKQYFRGYLSEEHYYGMPVYIHITRNGINHQSWSGRSPQEQERLAIEYKKWKDESISVNIFCNPEKYPEFFI